ncbi:MAG: hypothetical protein ACE5E9_14375 [Nitrospinaceae bacterium]
MKPLAMQNPLEPRPAYSRFLTDPEELDPEDEWTREIGQDLLVKTLFPWKSETGEADKGVDYENN